MDSEARRLKIIDTCHRFGGVVNVVCNLDATCAIDTSNAAAISGICGSLFVLFIIHYSSGPSFVIDLDGHQKVKL